MLQCKRFHIVEACEGRVPRLLAVKEGALLIRSPSALPFGLTLIKTEYWDRAGGGGNIGYDW